MLLSKSWDQLGTLVLAGSIYLGLSLFVILFLAPIRKTVLRRPLTFRIAAVDVTCLLIVLAVLVLVLRVFYPQPDRDFGPVTTTCAGLFLVAWATLAPRLAGNAMPVPWRVLFQVGVLPTLLLGPPLLAVTIVTCYVAPLGHGGATWSIHMIRTIDWAVLVGCSLGISASIAIVVYLGAVKDRP